MSNPSNLYAEKIFSEHPLVLWALDDKADYVSLMSELEKDIEGSWTVTGGSAISGTPSNTPNPIFTDSLSTAITGDVPDGDTNDIIAVSQDIINLTNLDFNLGSFSIGTYFYSNSIYISSVSIGYEYEDPEDSTIVQVLKTFDSPVYGEWSFISATFDTVNINAQFRAVIKVSTLSGGSTTSDYVSYINGISVGQWSEEFNATSLGTDVIAFPNTIAIDNDYAVIADAYGLANNNGYYLASETSLYAKNTSIPLVYGASGLTKIIPNNGKPSLIVPGKGFLNESGRFNEYTVEFWARIGCDAKTPKRIFGPIASSDGIYVESGFITLKIGNTFKSHFVGEWYRPMLIQIRLVKDSATLVLNGEEVVSINFETKSISLPSILNNPDTKEQDWLGFYAYSDVPEIEIDCFAIYPYQVPLTVSKRRWVYGQAVQSMEGIDSSYNGISTAIDYAFAGYSSNYNYPNYAKWQQASFDNVIASSNSLQTPDYKLPDIFLESKTASELFADNRDIQAGSNKFITFRPNSSWNNTTAYLNFPKFNIINDETHVVYAVIQIDQDDSSVQTIIEIQNTINKNKFTIKKDHGHIDYYLTFNGVEEEILTGQSFTIGEKLAVGIDIEELVSYFGGNVASFFGNKNGLTMYVGGNGTLANTFTGKIYSFGISTSFNESQIEDHFPSQGIASLNSAEQLLEHTASYTLIPTDAYDNFYLDIGVSGYWEDYMPLSYFAKYVKNDIGNQYYDLDFIQFNVDYPIPSTIIEQEVATESYTYADLNLAYSSPTQLTYAELDDPNTNGWFDYLDMSQASIIERVYDTSGSVVRSYISFQYIDAGANAIGSSFSTTVKPLASRIVSIDDSTSWLYSRFEIIDNTLIYPTKTVDFNKIAIVYRLDFNTRGILTKPIKVKTLSLASQVLSDTSFNPIGTKFGTNIFPYTKSGIYYDYKSKNPFSIYKGSTPYLYMTRDSGIEVRGSFDKQIDRGLAIPINSTKATDYSVTAMQMWYRNDEIYFPSEPTQLFEVRHSEDTIKFYLQSINTAGTRAKIFAVNNSSGQIFDSLAYYINGSIVREPVLTIKEWSIIGVSFSKALDFKSFTGSININGPGVFNNISYYKANDLKKIQSNTTRPWASIKEDGEIPLDWLYWKTNFRNWNGMLVVSSDSTYGVNPSEIYKAYIGINKIIIDDQEGMTLDTDKIKLYDSVSWSTSVVSPV